MKRGGQAHLFTSYNTASGGSIVNQVQRAFDGLGQLITEYQEHGGAVNTGTSLEVQYVWSEMADAGNHSRLEKMIYPEGSNVNFNYQSNLNDKIGRVDDVTAFGGQQATAMVSSLAFLPVGMSIFPC